MNEAQILKAYEFAKERYAAIGVDTDKAVETLEKTPTSSPRSAMPPSASTPTRPSKSSRKPPFPCTAGRPTT